MKKINYQNASVVRLKNRRVAVIRINPDLIGFEFRRLIEEGEVIEDSALVKTFKGKMKVTAISLSKEAAYALYEALQSILTLRDISADPLTRIVEFREEGEDETDI